VDVGLGDDAPERARETPGFERQLQVIERAFLDRGDDRLDLVLERSHEQRQPHALSAQMFEQLADGPVERPLAQENDPVVRRTIEQLGQIGIDLGMMTEGERGAGLFGAGPAVIVDDMNDVAVFHGPLVRHDGHRTHAEVIRK
jgi:hypothetical protein